MTRTLVESTSGSNGGAGSSNHSIGIDGRPTRRENDVPSEQGSASSRQMPPPPRQRHVPSTPDQDHQFHFFSDAFYESKEGSAFGQPDGKWNVMQWAPSLWAWFLAPQTQTPSPPTRRGPPVFLPRTTSLKKQQASPNVQPERKCTATPVRLSSLSAQRRSSANHGPTTAAAEAVREGGATNRRPDNRTSQDTILSDLHPSPPRLTPPPRGSAKPLRTRTDSGDTFVEPPSSELPEVVASPKSNSPSTSAGAASYKLISPPSRRHTVHSKSNLVNAEEDAKEGRRGAFDVSRRGLSMALEVPPTRMSFPTASGHNSPHNSSDVFTQAPRVESDPTQHLPSESAIPQPKAPENAKTVVGATENFGPEELASPSLRSRRQSRHPSTPALPAIDTTNASPVRTVMSGLSDDKSELAKVETGGSKFLGIPMAESPGAMSDC
ncbi:hypothetical protein DFJ73DRAFT_879585 [Zopfochytrium polystomum]|nr:hypothetical protein DFJ73DRAFT_879585 [Zopfochytrium polystomum]